MKNFIKIIKNLWKYSKKEMFYSWLFFFIIAIISESPHNTFVLFILTGIFTCIIIILAVVINLIKNYEKI